MTVVCTALTPSNDKESVARALTSVVESMPQPTSTFRNVRTFPHVFFYLYRLGQDLEPDVDQMLTSFLPNVDLI